DDLNRAGRFSGHKGTIVEHSALASETVKHRRRRDVTMLAQIPNGLSALRFALAAIWIELAAHGHQGRLAFAMVALVAAGSDFLRSGGRRDTFLHPDPHRAFVQPVRDRFGRARRARGASGKEPARSL